MAIRSRSLDDMIRDIKVSLRTGEPKRPAFTLLVGSGFSYPIIPTPTQMLRGDMRLQLAVDSNRRVTNA